jgi:hypothetical protein
VTDGPQTPLDEIKAEAHAATFAAMGEAGDIITAGIRDDISEPYPPASQPHAKPHSRTGNLLRGVAQQTYEVQGGVTTTIYVNRSSGDPLIPIFLEDGTQRMESREFMRPSFEEWSGKFMDVIPGLMEAHLFRK